jgi:hypothetical protein
MYTTKCPPLPGGLFLDGTSCNRWQKKLANVWAFPAPNKAGAQIFTVVACKPVDKYVVLGGRQAQHEVMPRLRKEGI